MLMICLSTAEAPDLNAALKRLHSHADVDLEQGSNSSEASSFQFDDCSVSVIHIPVAVPGQEVADSSANSRFWKPGSSTQHSSHVIVVGHGGECLERLESMVAVASAISAVAPTTCWYVGSASHVLEPSVGEAMLNSYDGAMPVWVNFISSENNAGMLDASTIGLEAFGHGEFEVVGTTRSSQEVFDQLMALSWYVLENGPVLMHGQTFGPSQSERYSIEVGTSRLGKPGTVIRLGM